MVQLIQSWLATACYEVGSVVASGDDDGGLYFS